MRFKSYLIESKNTLGADINEILVGYYCLGETWKGYENVSYVKQQLEKRKQQVEITEYKDQDGRAKLMAKEIIKWAVQHIGATNVVKKAWWTARPGELSKAVGFEVDSRKNPTDTLIQFSNGKFLGISAKSTKSKGDIGFKNPGIGTIEKAYRIDLSKIKSNIEDKTVIELELPKSLSERKKYIRENPHVQVKTTEAGNSILEALRNEFLKTLVSLDQEKSKSLLLSQWMDADISNPPYIKVTGHGKNGNYSVTILDPVNNPKVESLNNTISYEPLGRDSIGVTAGGKKIMKMRFKYESEKLASSIKLSGDPW
jgi:hypothetical protein